MLTLKNKNHRQHRMPKNPTEEQRIAWHIEHAKHCGCREILEKLKKQKLSIN